MCATRRASRENRYGKFFINPDGSQPLDADVCLQQQQNESGGGSGGGVAVSRRLVATPRVLAVARQQLACATLEGVAVEDSRHGLGVHWEATLAGPEIMALGDFTGETCVARCLLFELAGGVVVVVGGGSGRQRRLWRRCCWWRRRCWWWRRQRRRRRWRFCWYICAVVQVLCGAASCMPASIHARC
jgi:hypothetical protein